MAWIFTTSASLPMEPLLVCGSWIKPSLQVRDLGVYLNSDLSLRTHVNKLISVCYFHIRQLRQVRRSLTVDATHALVRAWIHSRLDYCNGLLAAQPDFVYKRLQTVLKSAARLVLRLPGGASVSALMRTSLHWLSYLQSISYKLCVMIYKCQHGLAPKYLEVRCTSVASLSGRASLRSAASHSLVVPFTRTVTMGPKSFSSAGPVAWNMLPPTLRDRTISLSAFKKQLKTFLFMM